MPLSSVPQSTFEHYREQQRLSVATIAASRRVWSGMGADLDASWRKVSGRLLLIATAAQLASARQGAAYVPQVLSETNQPDEPVGEVNPEALSGVAADGRSLNFLLYGAVVETQAASGGALATAAALARGGRWLDMAVQTMVADAGRNAVSVGIAARPQITGYTRMLNLPSCGRCAILAGKWFQWNQGFLRHPRCDCRHIPASEDIAGDFRTEPQAAYDAGQVRGLTKADQRAMADGADLQQIVNIRNPRRKGLASTSRRGSSRLTPEAIYQRAGDDRTEAIRLLRQGGYLT